MPITVESAERHHHGRDKRRTRDGADRDWLHAGSRAHVVQFYSDHRYLIRLLSQYIGTALVSGEAAIAIATPEHLEGVREVLDERGLDVAIAERQGRYVALDAADTLAKLLRGGMPDVERFNRVITGQIEHVIARSQPSRIAAFGEMVALLWQANRPEAAIRLEELWNDLAAKYDFSLCCAYPMSGFSSALHAAPFLRICAQHSHVFPAERRGGDFLQ